MSVVLLMLFVPNVSAPVQLFLQKFLVVTLLGYRANWFVSFDVFCGGSGVMGEYFCSVSCTYLLNIYILATCVQHIMQSNMCCCYCER